jgi:putative transposase
MSRAVDGQQLFRTRSPGSTEAERFVALMRRLEKACLIQVLTYALMSNHFHILCEVPERRTISDLELLGCIEAWSGRLHRDEVAEHLANWSAEAAQQLRQHYASRLFDISIFIKELKGRFAQWFNRRHERYGALWAERFKSVLIEEGPVLWAVAAYIDLNPLRAGLCEDPKDYRYCGYAEAVAKNSRSAQVGLARIVDLDATLPWSAVGKEYRKLLFRTGSRSSKAGIRIDPQMAHKVIQEQDGQIPICELVRSRVRYFTDGGIIGSQAFVREQFARCRGLRVTPPKSPAHRLRDFQDHEIWVLRNLRRKPVCW